VPFLSRAGPRPKVSHTTALSPPCVAHHAYNFSPTRRTSLHQPKRVSSRRHTRAAGLCPSLTLDNNPPRLRIGPRCSAVPAVPIETAAKSNLDNRIANPIFDFHSRHQLHSDTMTTAVAAAVTASLGPPSLDHSRPYATIAPSGSTISTAAPTRSSKGTSSHSPPTMNDPVLRRLSSEGKRSPNSGSS
jgi:hypothetical protein